MESAKQGSSETSSEENDRQAEVKEFSSASTLITARQSYECSFCKRGFTNAQALGGHMNIHRKDRANRTKGKQLANSSDSTKPNQEYKNPTFSAPISSEPTKHYPVLKAQKNYQMYFQPSAGSNPRQPHHDFLVPRSKASGINEELWGASLSLQIGSTNARDNVVNREVSKDDEVDLELRLGHDR